MTHFTQMEDHLLGAMSIATFCRTYHVGMTFTYEQIKRGKLRAVKAGTKTLILRTDAEIWVRGLPRIGAAS